MSRKETFRRKTIPVILLAGLVLPPVGYLTLLPASPQGTTADDNFTSTLEAAILREAENILRSVTPDGAINMAPIPRLGDPAYVCPYFATYAAMGLDIGALVLRNSNSQKAREYLGITANFYAWYAAHMNLDGSIHDYTRGTMMAPQSSDDADSHDGYAGAFLWGAYIHYSTARLFDREKADEFLNSMKPSLRRAANLILSLQKNDGLTIAKNSYPVQYLMDNLEVCAGLFSADRLGLSEFKQPGEKVAAALNRYYWLGKHLAWARDPHNGATSSGWLKWYPDKMANAWAVYFNFIQPERRSAIYTMLRQEYSNPEEAYTRLGPEMVYVALASAAQQDLQNAKSYMKELLKHQDENGGFLDANKYVHISGWFIATAALYLNTSEVASIFLL